MTTGKETAPATLAGHDERLTDVQVDQAVLMLSMLAEPTRLRLLWALRSDELGVSALAHAAECTPTAASQHLSKLRMVGLVHQRADGRARLYRLSGGHVLRLLAEALAQADHTVSGLPHHG